MYIVDNDNLMSIRRMVDNVNDRMIDGTKKNDGEWRKKLRAEQETNWNR